nr:cytochrome c oxidase subunit II [Asiopsocus sonorensis]
MSWLNINLQEAASPLMEQLKMFHDHSMMILIMITLTIAYLMIFLILTKTSNYTLTDNQYIEMIWTLTPAIILICIALPSLKILYLMDESSSPSLSIKSSAHQWYWTYEYTDFLNMEYDSYMIPPSNSLNKLRLLEVNNRLVIPFNLNIRMLITSMDVLHSWTIPSLSVKMDANPGRINQTSLIIKYPSILYGQCSEICGPLHSFMPIVMESTNKFLFIKWLKSFNS